MKKSFEEVFEDQTKYGTKVKTDEYCISGAHVIVDQGQGQIAGYTDREEGLFEDVPAIVFGDHTRVIKFVDAPFFLGADGVKVLRCRFENANYRYLYYALKSARIPNTGYNRHFKWLKETQINYPDAERQEEIVRILDRVMEVIDKRHQQLYAYDDLIKARFVEMFGDPIKNEHEWNVISLLESLEEGRTVSYGIVQTGDDYENGIPVFRPIDIAGGHIPKRSELKKTNPQISNQYKRTLLKGTELLITVRGSVGETFQTTAEFKGCNVGRNIVPLVTDNNKVNQRFLQELFAQDAVKEWLKGITKGIALQGLNMSEFKEMPVIVPPLEDQKAFVLFAIQVDKSKIAVQKSLDETQLLFDSLMQQYFG